MKKILIALDYGPAAKKVAETGFSLCTTEGAELTLLHVIADPIFYSSSAYDPVMGFGGYMNLDFLGPDILEDLKKASWGFLEKTKQHLGDDSIRIMVEEGGTATTILEVAKTLKADVIVMGSHSQHRRI